MALTKKKKKSNQYHNPVTVQTCFEIHWTGNTLYGCLERGKKINK